MKIEVISPDKKIYEGEVSSVILPGAKGDFQVLNNHAPIMSNLREGVIQLKNADGEENLSVTGGVVEINNNKIIVLV